MNHVSKIIIIIIIIIIKKIKTKVEKEEGIFSERESASGRDFIFYFFFSSLLSQIYGNQTVGFHRG